MFAAFRNLIPTSGGVNQEGTFTEHFDFFLDNSVDPVAVTIAKVGILSASLVAGVAGFLLLLFVSRKDAQDDSYKTDNLAETTA